MNLNNEFITLKEEIDAVVNKKSIEEKQKINNLNNLRSNISELITLISNILLFKLVILFAGVYSPCSS